MSRRRRQDPGIDGLLNIDKPEGWTSFDVVAYVRKRTGIARVGHGGTLDPAARGVLPIALGQATRVLEYLQTARKVYRTRIRLGISTTTYDREGLPVAERDPSRIQEADVLRALSAFRGEILQTPPMFSALKVQGVPLYKYARSGTEIERQPRPVTIYRADLIAFANPYLDLEIECSHGTYVRSIAHDLGEALGCGAHLVELVRTRSGPFRIEDAISIATLDHATERGDWIDHLRATDTALQTWQAAILGPTHAGALRNGQPVVLAVADNGTEQCRAYDVNGTFVGVLRRDGRSRLWRAEKVFRVTFLQRW